jgi:NDP-sugar pyrophosphorylase family protein
MKNDPYDGFGSQECISGSNETNEIFEHTDIGLFFDDVNWLRKIKEPWKLLRTSRDILLRNHNQFEIHKSVQIEKNATIVGKISVGENTKICNGSYIVGPAVIGNDAIIGPNCFIRSFTVLGNEVVVGHGVEIKNILCGHYTKFYHYCNIMDSIIGRNCSVSTGTITLVDRYDYQQIRCKIDAEKRNTQMTKFGCIIGNDTIISGNVVILPGIIIGSNCRIGFNVTIDRNVGDGKLVYTKQNLHVKNHRFKKPVWKDPSIRLEDDTISGDIHEQ